MKNLHRFLPLFFILVIVSYLFLSFFSPRDRTGSTMSSEPGGTKALFVLLERQGQKPVRWQQSIAELKSEDKKGTFIVIAPERRSRSASSWKPLREWARLGNEVIFFDNPLVPEVVLQQKIGLQFSETTKFLDMFQDYRGNLACGAEHAAFCRPGLYNIGPFRSWVKAKSPKIEILLGTNDAAYVVRRPLGAGSIIYFSDARLIENEFIDQFDNALLLRALLIGKSVFFDEFHHGYFEPTARDREHDRKTLILVGVVMAFVGLLIAASRAIRFGRAIPWAEEAMPLVTEYTSALGMLYCDHRAQEKLRCYEQAYRERLEQRFRISRNRTFAECCTELRAKQVISDAEIIEYSQSFQKLFDQSSAEEKRVAIRLLESLLKKDHSQYLSPLANQ